MALRNLDLGAWGSHGGNWAWAWACVKSEIYNMVGEMWEIYREGGWLVGQ